MGYLENGSRVVQDQFSNDTKLIAMPSKEFGHWDVHLNEPDTDLHLLHYRNGIVNLNGTAVSIFQLQEIVHLLLKCQHVDIMDSTGEGALPNG